MINKFIIDFRIAKLNEANKLKEDCYFNNYLIIADD